MDWIFSKPVTDITSTDLPQLLGLPEADRLECKREAYKRDDEGTREMLRDISAMANSTGGYLVIGADADASERIIAVEGIPNGEPEMLRMISTCRASIEEQILGLHCHPVPVGQDHHVLIWQVPRSTRRPHMVTFKGMYQCWTRHGTRKDRMSIEEIRDACVRTENIRTNRESFIQGRIGQSHRSSELELLLTATPLVVRDEVLDTGDPRLRELLGHPAYQRNCGWTIDFSQIGRRPRPTLYGLKVEWEGYVSFEVFRNGHMEALLTIKDQARNDEEQGAYIHPGPLTEYPLSFLHIVRSVLDHAGMQEPTVIGMKLMNVSGLNVRGELPGSALWRQPHGVSKWTESQHLTLPPMQIPYPLQPGKAAKLLCDRLWNAFGHEECPLFDADGHYLWASQ